MTSKQCTVVLNEVPVAKYSQYRAEGTRDAVEAEGLDIHNQRFGLRHCALKDAASLVWAVLCKSCSCVALTILEEEEGFYKLILQPSAS